MTASTIDAPARGEQQLREQQGGEDGEEDHRDDGRT